MVRSCTQDDLIKLCYRNSKIDGQGQGMNRVRKVIKTPPRKT